MVRFKAASIACALVLLFAGVAYAQSDPCAAALFVRCSYLPLAQLQPTETPIPLPTVTPKPPAPSLHVLSYRMVTSSTGSIHVYGEVENTTNKPAYFVKVIGKFYDAANNFVATDYTYTFFTKTDVSARNPFDLLLTNPPAGIVRVDLTLAVSSSSYLTYVPISVVSQQTRDNYGLEVFGEVRNDQGRQVKSVQLALTVYDFSGGVYYTDFSYADVTTLDPGATSTYKVSTFAKDLGGLNYAVQAQGYFAP